MFRRVIRILILFLLAVRHHVNAIKCVRCEGVECTHLNLTPKQCPREVKGCVSYLRHKDTEYHYDESFIDRDCFDRIMQKKCSTSEIASLRCHYCDHADGCNMEFQEPIICRYCEYTTGPQSWTCERTKVCQPLFRTIPPFCYILRGSQDLGIRYDCSSTGMWYLKNYLVNHGSVDQLRISYIQCDSNECNSGLDQLFVNHTDLMGTTAETRYCYSGRRHNYGFVACDQHDIMGQHCFSIPVRPLGVNSTKLDTPQVVGCYRNKQAALYDVEFHKKLSTYGNVMICNTNGCNPPDAKPLYSCHAPANTVQHVQLKSDACATFIDQVNGYMPLGRKHHRYCKDSKRCLLCRSHLCNTRENMTRLYCYHTNGPEGYYIRRTQLDYMDMCEAHQKYCITTFMGSSVTRGCGDGSEVGAFFCQTNLCNRQIGGIYCYGCTATNPNCVFSQNEGPFELCPPPSTGCFTRIFGDSSVERGCATERVQDVLDSKYIFCDDSMLCNSRTTVAHSCHIFHTQVYKPYALPNNVPSPYKTREGWLFEACPDDWALPACYTRTYTRDKRAYLESGCTSGIFEQAFLFYRRGLGQMGGKTSLCDGHYCNKLPSDAQGWISIDGK